MWPDAREAEIRQHSERLAPLSGAAFDREYMRLMVERHEDAIRQSEARLDSDHEPLRAWAEKTLATLRKHLEGAQQIQAGVEPRPLP